MKNWKTKRMYFEESADSRELELYAENTREVYDRILKPTLDNLIKKANKGTFDPLKAIKAFYNVATFASECYKKEFGYMFNTQSRYTVAVLLFEVWVVIDDNNDFEALKKKQIAEIIKFDNFKQELAKVA